MAVCSLDNRTYWPYGWSALLDDAKPGFVQAAALPERPVRCRAAGWNYYSLYAHRSGWSAAEFKGRREEHYEKRLPRGWTLHKRVTHSGDNTTLRGTEHEEHRLVHERGHEIDATAWEWADWDAFGKRLTWASEGRLFAGKLNSTGLKNIAELFDFNPMTFEAIEAPY